MEQEENSSKRYNGRDGAKQIRENHLDFLYELHQSGVDIGEDKVLLLKQKGYIQQEKKEKKEASLDDNINFDKLKFSSQRQKEIDASIDIVLDGDSDDVISEEELLNNENLLYQGGREIERKDFIPKSVTEHTDDFIEWIDSINRKGFSNKKNYKKFNLYLQQSAQWMQDNSSYADIYDESEKEDFIMRELERCSQNALYFMNRYVYYKEGDAKAGKAKYVARPMHEVIIYLIDCGYSIGFAKPRQVAATTTLMALSVYDIVFKINYFMKFVTEDKEKAEEIFEDKLKYTFSELPDWMRPNVLNERDNLFRLGYKHEKGERGGVNSTIRVVAPKRTVIAGGAPQKVMIDEAGNIPILGQMIDNARPTMLWLNPETSKLEIKRQLVYWGTGGEMEKGGRAFETVFTANLKMWDERNFSSATIPLFFDWTTRIGMTKEMYDSEKAVAYSKEGIEAKQARIEFHQSYPSSISDVFKISGKTLVDEEYLDNAIQRIRDSKVKTGFQLEQCGYFEPVYDYDKPSDESSDVPYKIIGAEFIPTSDIDERKSVTIFLHPKKGWINRYYQGTDPIDTDTGLSNMASSVWDKHYKTVAAVLNFRTRDYRQVFLQTMLLGIYYDVNNDSKISIKELIESNRGTSYKQYKEDKGYGNELVINRELPMAFQNRTTINEGVGIDNKGIRNTMIINRLFELINAYGDNIYCETFFEQLKTFTCDVRESGKEVWGPSNRKYVKDDVLFSTVFSYICAELCFPELIPQNLTTEDRKMTVSYDLVYDKNYNLVRVPVKKFTNGRY